MYMHRRDPENSIRTSSSARRARSTGLSIRARGLRASYTPTQVIVRLLTAFARDPVDNCCRYLDIDIYNMSFVPFPPNACVGIGCLPVV